MSNLDPNRYTDTETDRLLQVLLEAAGTENRVRALDLAKTLLHSAEASGRARDAAEAAYFYLDGLVQVFVNKLHLDAESSQRVVDAAGAVWNFFRTHHSRNKNQILGVINRLSVIPPERAEIQGSSITSGLSSLSSASNASFFGVPIHSVGSDAAPSGVSGLPNSVDSNCLVTQEVDGYHQQEEQRNIPAVEDEDEEDEQKPRAFKRSNDDGNDDKNNHKKKKPDSED